MKVSSLKLFSLLVFLYMIYIIIEFAFNFELLSVSSGFRINKIEDLDMIELVGKSLSSIGAGVFVYTLLSNITKGSKNFYINATIALITSGVFFVVQEKIVDSFISSTDVDFRDNSEASLILKTGILNGSLISSDYGLPATDNEHQNRAFLTGLGILMQGYSPKLNDLYDRKDTIYPIIFKREVEDNQEDLYKEYLNHNNKVYAHWYDYKDFYESIDYNYKLLSDKVKYSPLMSDLKYLKSSHESYVRDYNGYRRNRMQVANDLSIYYMDFIGCEDYVCVTQGRGKKFFTRHIDKVIKGRFDLYPYFMEQCSFNTSNDPKGSVYIDGKLYVQKKSRMSGRNNNYSCKINSNELYSIYHKNYERISFDKFGIRSLVNFKSFNDFANSPDVKKIIAEKSIDYGIDLKGIDISKTYIDYRSEGSFKKSIEKVLRSSYEKEYNNSLMDRYGVTIPLGIKKIEDFANTSGFRKILLDETKGLVDIKEWGFNLTREQFLSKSVKTLPNKMINNFSSKNLRNDYGELITKAVVVPPVLIALSLFFGVFNSINLIFIVFGRFYFEKIGFYSFNALRVMFYLAALYIPIVFGGGILEDPLMAEIMSELRSGSLIFYYSFKWVIGVYYFI